MSFAVSQTQSTAPRTAEHIPFFDAEFLAQSFDVFNQIPRRVFFEFGVRRGLPRTTLIEQNDMIRLRIEKPPIHRNQTAARTTVQENHRNSVGVSAAFVINRV